MLNPPLHGQKSSKKNSWSRIPAATDSHFGLAKFQNKLDREGVRKYYFQNNVPSDRATARNGISSISVERRTGPLWPIFGRFQTTRGTPLLHTTLPPLLWILKFMKNIC